MKALSLPAVMVVLLSGCASGEYRAPVVQLDESNSAPVTVPVQTKLSTTAVVEASDRDDWRPEEYVVQKGDTLYNIAFNFGLDYREIAASNGIEDPNIIKIGQRLRIMNRKVEPAQGGGVATVVPVSVEIKPLMREDSAVVSNLDGQSVVVSQAAPVVPVVTPVPVPANKIKSWPKLVKYAYSEDAVAKIKQQNERVAVPAAKPVVDNKSVASVAAPIAVPNTVTEPAKPVVAAATALDKASVATPVVPVSPAVPVAAAVVKPPEKMLPEKTNTEKPSVVEETTASSKVRSIDDGEGGKIEWAMPTGGKIIARFAEGNSQKGVDISGKVGQPVLAAAGGKVVYSGSGLRGYGNLVIIKHNKTYISAYAHNKKILVKEGDTVKRGQKIGEMGDTDADQVKLHFEVRRYGRPVDPIKYLPFESS